MLPTYSYQDADLLFITGRTDLVAVAMAAAVAKGVAMGLNTC